MEKIISNKVRKNLNEHTARIILERSDRMASSTLEQLRKSTDRAYTMTGFLLTVFIALTAFVFSSPSLWQLSTAVVLWSGIFIALYIMVNQVLWVHPFRHTGNEPRNMIQEYRQAPEERVQPGRDELPILHQYPARCHPP